MSFAGLLGALKRRWYVVLLGLLMTGALTWGAALAFPPDYSARGLVILLPPPSEEEGNNPFLNMGGLELPARVLATYFTSNPAQLEIKALAPDAEVAVTIDESTRGPVIAVDVLDTTPESTLDVLWFVVDEIPVVLARLQAEVGVGEEAAVTSMPLTIDTETEVDYSRQTRVVLAAVAVGLAATALVTFALDGLLLRRTRIREARVRSSDLPPPPDEPAGTQPSPRTDPAENVEPSADPQEGTTPWQPEASGPPDDVAVEPAAPGDTRKRRSKRDQEAELEPTRRP